MKRRTFFSILAGIVLLLLSIAGGSLYWVLAQSPLNLLSGGVLANPSAAIFVPKQAPVVVSLLTNPEELEAFVQIVAPPNQQDRARSQFEQIKEGLLANTEIDYSQDIEPWLGEEITFALTASDFDRNPENGIQPGYLLVAGSKDGDLARQFLQLFYGKNAIAGKSEVTFENYKGVSLIYRRNLADNRTSSASAIVGDRFVLFANAPRILREAIDKVQAVDLNLEHNPIYQNALAEIQTPRIGVGVVNLPGLAAWIAKQPLPPELNQTLTVSLTLDRQGLIAQTALAGLNGSDTLSPTLSAPVKALEYVPENTRLTVAGADLLQLWQQVSARVEANPTLAPLLDRTVARLNENLGLDVVKEIFSWARGEYALALLPASEGEETPWLFAAQNTPEAEAAIARLDEQAKAEDLSVGNFSLNQQKITIWTALTSIGGGVNRLEARVKGARTTLGDYIILSNSLVGIEQVLGGSDRSLLANQEFKNAIALLPKKNDGYFYLNWGQSQSLFEQNIPLFRAIEFAGRPLFQNLRSLVLSSNGRENGVSRASIFFNLGSNSTF